jgi:protein-tyrosine phosphatase
MNFSTITNDLFIGTTPSVVEYNQLRDLGVRLIINMRFRYGPEPDLHIPPIDLLWLRTIDSPFFPIPIDKLMRCVQTALNTIRDGGKVYSHCVRGAHRSVAMGAAILIAQGHDVDAAIQLIKFHRKTADPYVFYIRNRILRFANQWKANAG